MATPNTTPTERVRPSYFGTVIRPQANGSYGQKEDSKQTELLFIFSYSVEEPQF